jgi:hypothetical protein
MRIIVICLFLFGCTVKKELPIEVDAFCYEKLTDLHISHNDAKRRCTYKGLK